MIGFRRRDLSLLAGGGLLHAPLAGSEPDFWNKKPPADWTPAEIDRLLQDSPWAKQITPTYTSVPPPIDRRPWGETPPIGPRPIPKTQRPI